MKKIVLSVMCLAGVSAISQENDQVSTGAGYVNQSYYSLENGEVLNVSNTDWDLAFDASGFGSGIRINGQNGIELYVSPSDTVDWLTVDTLGMTSWTNVIDSDLSWSNGAFNADFDENDAGDLGWGAYNTITHTITGNKIFVVKSGNSWAKKIWIKSLVGGTYTVYYSDLDNSNVVTKTITKADYTDKNYVYYNLANETILDKEPANNTWDLVFTKYVAKIAPNTPYGVSGVLLNKNTTAYKNLSIETNAANFDAVIPLATEINTIGYNWKSYVFGTGYVMDDSATYFIKTANGDYWKLGFIDFGGSANGNFEFIKEKIGVSGLVDSKGNEFSMFPNPAIQQVSITSAMDGNVLVKIINMNGQVVFQSINKFDGQIETIDLTDFSKGFYMVSMQYDNGAVVQQKLIIK